MKAIPRESWLLYLAWAPFNPQPRPSYTVPSSPTRKLKQPEWQLAPWCWPIQVHDTETSETARHTSEELLTCIQCHQSLFQSYGLSGCWPGGPCTPSGQSTSGGLCGEWKLSEQGRSEPPSSEGKPLPTAPLKQLKSNIEKMKQRLMASVFKVSSITPFVAVPSGSISTCTDASAPDEWTQQPVKQHYQHSSSHRCGRGKYTFLFVFGYLWY